MAISGSDDEGVVPVAPLARLAEMHTSATFLLTMTIDEATYRLHPGVGTLRYGGETYHGVGALTTDGGVGRLVQISDVQLPDGDSAPATTVTISPVDAELVRSARAEASIVEGQAASLSLAVWDDLWQPMTSEPVELFAGLLTGLALRRADGLSELSITIGSIFEARSFAPSRTYTAADQRARYPDDGLFDLAGQTVEELWGPDL